MGIHEAVDILKERVKVDRYIRENKAETDFEKYCEDQCLAIEKLIEEVGNGQD